MKAKQGKAIGEGDGAGRWGIGSSLKHWDISFSLKGKHWDILFSLKKKIKQLNHLKDKSGFRDSPDSVLMEKK